MTAEIGNFIQQRKIYQMHAMRTLTGKPQLQAAPNHVPVLARDLVYMLELLTEYAQTITLLTKQLHERKPK
jgi:hypothetical protein